MTMAKSLSNRSWLYLSAFLILFVSEIVGYASSLELVVANWGIPHGDSLPPRTAAVGDTVSFSWSGYYDYDVFLHPSGNCNPEGSVEVGLDSPAKYTFTAEDAEKGEVVFACEIDNGALCGEGMIVVFTVIKERLRGELDVVEKWFIPYGQPSLPPRNAAVGDIAEFRWDSNYGRYDVYKHPSGNCDAKDSILVGDVPRAQYTFTEDDIGEVVFACQQGQGAFCENGMILTYTVYATRDDIPLPTPAPSRGARFTPAPARGSVKITPSPSVGKKTTPPPSKSKSVPTTATNNFDSSGPETDDEPTQSPIDRAVTLPTSTLTAAREETNSKSSLKIIVFGIIVGLLVVGSGGFFALRRFGVTGHRNSSFN